MTDNLDFLIENGGAVDFRLLAEGEPEDLIILDPEAAADFLPADEADDVLLELPAGEPLLEMEICGEAILSDVYPEYDGIYDVLPGPEAQELKTRYRSVLDNIRIAPIPKNYGLITYNGRTITVS